MKSIVKYSLGAILLMLGIAGFLATTSLTPAKSVTGSFDPQTQFPVGSSIKITPIYGVGTASMRFGPDGPNPPDNNQTTPQNLPPPRNHTGPHGPTNSTMPAWNQTGQHKPPFNQTGQQMPHWNKTDEQIHTMYSTSITINAKVSNSTADGDIEWIIQSGSIVFNGTTYTITSGNGRMTKINQLVMFGDAKDSSGSTIRWSLQGLAAIYNGRVIVELNGHSFNETNDFASTSDKGLADVGLTYIATMN